MQLEWFIFCFDFAFIIFIINYVWVNVSLECSVTQVAKYNCILFFRSGVKTNFSRWLSAWGVFLLCSSNWLTLSVGKGSLKIIFGNFICPRSNQCETYLHTCAACMQQSMCSLELLVHLRLIREFFRRRYSTQTKHFKKITAIKCSNEQFTATLLAFFCFIYT